jgi:hypothetical protein
MKEHESICEHRWRYFVNVQSKAVRIRVCERCDRRAVVPTVIEPLAARRFRVGSRAG